MSKNTPKKTGINKNEPVDSIPGAEINQIKIEIDDEQRILIEKLANILHKIIVNQPDGSASPLIPDKSLTGFGRSALSFMANVYMTNVLSKSEIAKSLPDKQALNEFVAFRAKYMQFPIDMQIQDLKRVGVVK